MYSCYVSPARNARQTLSQELCSMAGYGVGKGALGWGRDAKASSEHLQMAAKQSELGPYLHSGQHEQGCRAQQQQAPHML